MKTRVEGTLVFDGLIEGRMPTGDRRAELLHAWADKARAAGLALDVEVEAGQFSLLADPTPVRARRLGDVPAARVKELLERLVALFADAGETAFFSTLRSVEIRPGQEVQTVYLIRPDGRVEAPERLLDVKTTGRARTPGEGTGVPWRGVLGVLLLLALLLGASVLLLRGGGDRGTVDGWGRNGPPIDLAALEVDASAFEGLLTVEAPEAGDGPADLVLRLARGPDFPGDGAAFRRAYAQAGDDAAARLRLDALFRGQGRVELFDAEGAYLGQAPLRLLGLREAVRSRVPLTLPRGIHPRRLVLRY